MTRDVPMDRRLFAALALITALASTAAQAAPSCPGNDDALGTARVLSVDPATMPRVGRKHFPQTLPLQPERGRAHLRRRAGRHLDTTRARRAQARMRARRRFFLLGRSAIAHPALARRELARGPHRRPPHLRTSAARPHAARGGRRPRSTAASPLIDTVLYGKSGESAPVTPFFRFPGFASSTAAAGLARAPRHRGVRRRSMGK